MDVVKLLRVDDLAKWLKIMNKMLKAELHGILGELVKLRTFNGEVSSKGRAAETLFFLFRTTSADSQACREAESNLEERKDVLTFA